ncbi:sulfite exporter TauE/SafE family protein [soil metagenome]
MLTLVLLFLLALAAGVLGGIVGTGSSLVLLPVLVLLYGPRVAVPVMGIAAVMGNIGRVIAWWRQIRWRPVLAYSIPGIPAAALGAHTLLSIPPTVIDVCLAAFFLGMIPLRRVIRRKRLTLRLWHLVIAGALIGFLTGLVLSTGPLSVPVFTGYGLSGGAFLGTEAASAVLLYAAKLTAFASAGALPSIVILRGLIIGTALLVGALLARRIVRRIHPRTYELLVDGVLVVGAIGMIASLAG